MYTINDRSFMTYLIGLHGHVHFQTALISFKWRALYRNIESYPDIHAMKNFLFQFKKIDLFQTPTTWISRTIVVFVHIY